MTTRSTSMVTLVSLLSCLFVAQAQAAGAPLIVDVKLNSEPKNGALLPLAIKVTNSSGREILLSFNAEFLPNFDFTPKGPALTEIAPPWAPSVPSQVYRLQPGAHYLGFADLSQFVGFVAVGRGEVAYKAELHFWNVREDGTAAEETQKFNVEGNLVVEVTPGLLEKAKGQPRIGWDIKRDK